ncbi:MchC protein [Vibrio cholerae]|nr:hypothetical protein A5A_020203 [Vibrio cholerae MZO-2]OEC28740.1 MchC protein [Vibrio cholerae]
MYQEFFIVSLEKKNLFIVGNFMSDIFTTHLNPTSDNTTLINRELSEYSFVSYKTYKLKNTEIAWINRKYIDELGLIPSDIEKSLLENFSYVSEGYTTDEELDLTDSKIFLADRYGNPGDAGNGGSARCGLNGHFQVKGNGTNPLGAVNVDEGHSHGKLPLSEAVSEAIWSEICHKELPYGALRIIAIIRTSQTILTTNTFGDVVEQPCALMIREVAIRPAHYEPALNFWPKPEFVRLRDANSKVLELAVNKLENNEYQKTNSHKPIFDVVERFVKRFATQVAVSRVKGFPHGSLTSSNIALDGRFLDLGTMSAIGDFSNVILTAGLGATWDDHLGIADWLWNFFYYLNKYSVHPLTQDEQEQLVKHFLETLEEQENITTATECGIPPDTKEINKVGKIIKEHLRTGKHHVSRLSKCSFNRDLFLADVKNALEKVGHTNSRPNFKYRNIKYNRFSIFSDNRLQGLCGSRNDLEDMFEEYLS